MLNKDVSLLYFVCLHVGLFAHLLFRFVCLLAHLFVCKWVLVSSSVDTGLPVAKMYFPSCILDISYNFFPSLNVFVNFVLALVTIVLMYSVISTMICILPYFII